MAKQASKKKAPVVTGVSANAVALAKGMTEVLQSVGTSGALLAVVCTDAIKRYKNQPIPETDAKYVVNELARVLEWQPKSITSRTSDVNVILKHYQKLPEAIEELRTNKAGKPTSFSNVLQLARGIKRGKTPKQAVLALVKGNKATDPKSRTMDEARKSVKGHINRCLQFTQLPAKFRSALREACEEHGVVL